MKKHLRGSILKTLCGKDDDVSHIVERAKDATCKSCLRKPFRFQLFAEVKKKYGLEEVPA